MAEISLEETPQPVRDLFNRGFAAFERKNWDYAIDMMIAALEIEPRLLAARKYVRAAEIKKQRAAGGGAMGAAVAAVKALPLMGKVSALVKMGKTDKALVAAERLLTYDALKPEFVLLFADAAMQAELPEAALHSLVAAREHKPDNIKLLKRLAALYVEIGDTAAARDCYEKLSEMKPNDPEFIKAYKDSMAVDSMSRDGWSQASSGGSFRDIIKDSDEAVRLEQEAKAVKSEKDAESLIADMLGKIEKEPDNMNYYRSLGRLYTQNQQFDEAESVLEQALKRSPGDPELDQSLSTVRIQRIDAHIRELREGGDVEAAQQLEQQKADFIRADLDDRIRRYPNDLRLRYDYGVALYAEGKINEAIQQFQASQRSPKQRILSLYYLALCFKHKNQYDLAAQQLSMASDEIVGMTATKKDILYELGTLAELTGNREKAGAYFKEIYQVDIGYKDVAEKVEKVYS